jgi:hypothetical protein
MDSCMVLEKYLIDLECFKVSFLTEKALKGNTYINNQKIITLEII